MRAALADKPEKPSKRPDGIVTVRIDPETGKRAGPNDPDAIFEIFRQSEIPPLEEGSQSGEGKNGQMLPEELF